MFVPDQAAALDYEWAQVSPTFTEFHNARDLTGLYKGIMHAKVPPDLHPTLRKYAQGMQRMTGKLREDFRQLKQLHNTNPTLISTRVRGISDASRTLERDYKLVWASWWDNYLNVGRIADSRNYEGQIGLGCGIEREEWRPIFDEDGHSGCPLTLTNVLIDACWWHGDFQNPDAFWYRYSLSIIDCDVKNSEGERPGYGTDGYDVEKLGWVSQDLPRDFYLVNANKKVDIIVRDAVDLMAMCPVKGCTHRKRRISTYICKTGAKADDYMEVSTVDSPFEKCSFVVTGGDVNRTERDPHEILRPSAWILMDLVMLYNNLFSSLLATFAREMAQDQLYLNAGATDPAVLQALSPEDDGQELKKPADGTDSIARMPGPIQSFPMPRTDTLMRLLDKCEADYDLYRPNRTLTGQAAVSEVTGTAAQLNKQGAGLMLQENLNNWDASHDRFFYETRHAILFTDHFESEGSKKRYIGVVSGRENVMGARGEPGEELYLDAKKCAIKPDFKAVTSADTPQDRRDREERARTGRAAGILSFDQVLEDYGIQDIPAHKEELLAEKLDTIIDPMVLRRVAGLIMALSASETGVDMGEEGLVKDLPIPDMKSPQTYNTLAANNSRLHTPPVELAPTNSQGMGGASGLG